MRRLSVIGLVMVLLGCKMLGNKEQDNGTVAGSAEAEPVAPPSAGAATPPSKVDVAAKPDGFSLMPIQVGQFVEYKVKGGKGSDRYAWAVTGKEGDAFWLQVVSDMKGQAAAVQMLMKVKTAADINDASPEKMRFKVPGRGVQELGGAMMKMASKYKPADGIMLKMDPAAIAKGSQQDVKVPAGTFTGAFKWVGDTKWQGKKMKTTFLSHPSIPITGIARGSDGVRTWELAKFGKTGAKDEMQ